MKKYIAVLTGIVLAFTALSAYAWDNYSVKVRGKAFGQLAERVNLPSINGDELFRTESSGDFAFVVGGEKRKGYFQFPHMIRIPAGGPAAPTGGKVAGIAYWWFYDGVTCVGPWAGDISMNGSEARGKFECDDGTELRLRVTKEDNNGMGGLTTTVRGRLIYPYD